MDAIVEAPWQVRLDEEMLTVIYIKRSNQRLNGPGGDLVVESNNDTIDGSHHGFSISFDWRLAINLIHWTGCQPVTMKYFVTV